MINKRWITLPVGYSRRFTSKAVFWAILKKLDFAVDEQSTANSNSFKIAYRFISEANICWSFHQKIKTGFTQTVNLLSIEWQSRVKGSNIYHYIVYQTLSLMKKQCEEILSFLYNHEVLNLLLMADEILAKSVVAQFFRIWNRSSTLSKITSV